MHINFQCPTCGNDTKNEISGYLEFSIAGYDDVVLWSDLASEIPQANESGWWSRSDKLPQIGEERVVNVRHPFNEALNGEFWTLYTPALSSINGWDEHPEEIEQSAFIKCRATNILAQTETEGWVQVEVMDCIRLNEVTRKFSAKNEPHPLFQRIFEFPSRIIQSFGKWQLYQGNAQGDLGNWLLIELVNDKPHVVAIGEWSFHQNVAYLGNVVLMDRTYQEMVERCGSA